MTEASDRESSGLRPVFEYTDYRKFLRDYYDEAKATKRNFSFRAFCRICGFKSPNFLLLVMNGKSALSSVSAEKVILGLKFNREEGEFFRNLVAFNEAKSNEKRAHHARKLMQSRTYKRIFQLSEAQYKYLGTWFMPVIRSVIGLECFKADVEWIAERMRPALKAEQVKRAIEEMILLGLVKKSEKGKLSQNERMVGTPSEITSSFAAQYHQQMLKLAGESIDRFKREERHLAGMTVALDQAAVAKAKELAERFRNEIMELSANCESADAIYQVNLQLFPLFQGKGDKK